MAPALILAAGVIGLVAGPPLNVVADRVPVGLPVNRPGPSCPRCRARRGWRECLPVVSWLHARGRCRGCGWAIPLRCPAVEVATATLFAVAALRIGWEPALPAVLVFFAGLVALAACDLEHHLLPRRIVHPTAVAAGGLLVVASASTGEWRRLVVAGVCGLVAFGLLYAVHAARSGWLGFGDVRLGALIGGVLGWLSLEALWVGFLVADVLGLVVMAGLIVAGRAQRGAAFPFGVFLAAGAVAAVLV